MRYLFSPSFLFVSLLLLLCCYNSYAQQRASDMIDFEVSEHNFGEIEQGTPVYHTFAFKNTLNKPIIVENVLTSCGCTSPEWSKEPISPKGVSKIKIGYNAATLGVFHKSIQVILQGANVPYILKIKGEVKKK